MSAFHNRCAGVCVCVWCTSRRLLTSLRVCIAACSHNLGMSTNLKHDRLIQHCRVIDNEICFNSKEVYNL